MSIKEEINLAPVVVFGYNRPDHIRKCLMALNDCLMADKTDIYIFVDGPKKESEQENVCMVQSVVIDFEKKSNFASTTYYFKDNNFGLANSIIEGVSRIIEKYGRVIVVEDDLIVNPFFIKYSNEALDFYKNNVQIWSVSAFSYDLNSLREYKRDVFFVRRGCSCGWATWKDRWETVDWKCKKYNTFLYMIYYSWLFMLGGRDLPIMLREQMNGKIDSWAVRWCFSQACQKKITVYPWKSLIENIGCDGSGIHSGNNIINSTYSQDFGKKVEFCEVVNNHKINKEFRNQYGFGFFYYLEYVIKIHLKKILVIKKNR